ncbi:MAG: hypothetical protein GXO85_10265 [Chlorobi bacterium]|nr:hypothetical protein [Chlorobiota bacterium]
MKTIIKILIILYSILLISCEGIVNDGGTIPIDPPPTPGHIEQKLSLLGDKIAFFSEYDQGILKILNLKNGKIKNIIIQDKLPTNMYLLGIGTIFWSPYDNNKLLIYAATSTDTVGDGKRYHYGEHLFFLNLENSELQIITPKVLGSIGAAEMSVHSWLPESNKDMDFIQISFSKSMYSSSKISGQFIYIPQKDSLMDYKVKDIYAFTRKETSFDPWMFFSFSLDYRNNYERIYSIDQYSLDYHSAYYPIQRYKCKFDRQHLLTKASWSPNGKYLALSVRNIENGPYYAIWLIDIEKFLNNIHYILHPKQITLNNNKSMRLFGDIWAEFITDSTMAVTILKKDDDFAYLWEITIDGKIVRQLTFEP